jgi:hypothetical protein
LSTACPLCDLDAGQRLDGDRIEVADQHVHGEPDVGGEFGSAVGGDHDRADRHGDGRRPIRSRGEHDDDRAAHDFVPRHPRTRLIS